MGKLKEIIDAISDVEEKLGIKKLMEYTLFFMIIYATFNFTSIVKSIMEIQETIERKEHQKKLELRDEFMDEITPMLVEMRIKAGAQRVLYFEYHNSTENLIGIPFKYINLITIKQEYGIPWFDREKYRDINSGFLGTMYGDLKKVGILLNNDKTFKQKYPEIDSFFSTVDGSKIQMFINLPGINEPLGMVVLEWLEPTDKTEEDWDKLEDWLSRINVPRINRLIDSKIE